MRPIVTTVMTCHRIGRVIRVRQTNRAVEHATFYPSLSVIAGADSVIAGTVYARDLHT